MILQKRWKSGVLGLILLITFMVFHVLKITDHLQSDTASLRFWLLWLSSLLIMRVVFRMLTFVIIQIIHKSSTSHWVDYYAKELDVQLTPTVLVSFGLAMYKVLMSGYILGDDLDLDDDDGFYLALYRVLLCLNILMVSLLAKSLMIKWMAIRFYFSRYAAKIKKIRRNEEWIRMLLGNERIFNQKPLEFLHLKPVRNHEFRLEVLEKEEDLAAWIEDDDNAEMVEFQTLLWSFSAKSSSSKVITDEELKRICRVFAKLIMHRIRTLVACKQQQQQSSVLNQKRSTVIGAIKRMVTITKTVQEIAAVRSVMSVSHRFLIFEDFVAVFGRAQIKRAQKAFRALNDTKTGRITQKQLQRGLYRWIRGLLYLKQVQVSCFDLAKISK